MSKSKFWTVEQAITEADKIGIKVSAPTIYKWIDTFKIGHQPGGKGGKRYVYPKKFMNFIQGKSYGNEEKEKENN